MKALGILLVVLGILAIAVPGINSLRKERILAVGPVEVVAKKKESPSYFPLLGVTALATGGAILVAGVITQKKK